MKLRTILSGYLCCCAISCLSSVTVVARAQEDGSNEVESADASSGSTTATVKREIDLVQGTPPTSGIVAPSTEAAAAMRSEFDAKSKRFREVFKRLNSLRHYYPFADNNQRVVEMQDEWNGLKAEGEQVIVEMQRLALPLFLTEPNRNSMLYRFLFDMLVESVERGRYFTGYRVALLMRETVGYERPLEQIVSLAAFMNNQHDEFMAYVQEVGPDGLLEKHQIALSMFEDIRAKWNREKVIRQAEAEQDDLPQVVLKTSEGDVVLELFENEAPNTVASFINLVESKFYDGLNFHRVLDGFVAQGGCPFGTGQGGPDYRVACECYQENKRDHFLGSLSMAHGGRDTGGSQFFIVFGPQPQLDGKHTVFGRVISGMEFAEQFERIDPEKAKGDENPTTIIEAKVLRKRDHEYQVKKLPLLTATK